MEFRNAAVQMYFKSMVAYRISKLTSRLALIQNELTENSEAMDIRRMDDTLNFLEDLSSILEDFKG